MTIYTQFDPTEHADGTTMVSLGWTDYPGRSAPGGTFGPAPNWHVSGGAIVQDAGGSRQLPWPRTFFDVGAPFTRGQALLQDGRECVILASDPFNFITMGRIHFPGPLTGMSQDQIGFTMYVNGDLSGAAAFTGSISGNTLTVTSMTSGKVEPGAAIIGSGIAAGTKILADLTGNAGPGTYTVSISQSVASTLISAPKWFDYFARYNPTLHHNQYENLPPVANVSWVVSGGTLTLYVDGVPQKLAFGTGTDYEIPNIPLPPHMIGAQMAGYAVNRYSGASFVYPVTYRDNNDYLEIQQVSAVRYDATTSKVHIPGFCNITGATTIQVTVKDEDGTTVAAGLAPVSGTSWSIDLGPIPKELESTLLSITATNTDGSTTDNGASFFPMPITVTLQETSIGQNGTYTNYYTSGWPFNDLAKCQPWESTVEVPGHRGVAYILPPWRDATNSLQPMCWPSTYVNLQDNGSPTKFPDDPTANLSMRLPWYPELGDYVINLTEAPDLNFSILSPGGDPSRFTVTMNFYGPNLHKLSVLAVPIFNHNIVITRNSSAANQGMPTTPWLLHITKCGSSGSWNQAVIAWWRNSAVRHIRWMTDQFANELYAIGLPFDSITSATRYKPSSQTWGESGNGTPAIPIEVMIELHNILKKDIWLNVTRIASSTYNQELAELLRDTLDPTLKIYLPRSNEVWNFGFVGQRGGYQRDGYSRGLGRLGSVSVAATANLTIDSNVIDITAAAGGTLEVGMPVTGVGVTSGHTLAGASIQYSTTSGSNVLTVTILRAGLIVIGGTLVGAGIPAGTSILALGTGVGGPGTYIMSEDATATGTVDGHQWLGTGTGGTGTYAISGDATATGTDVALRIGCSVYGANNGAWPDSYPTWTSGTSYAANDLAFEPNGFVARAKKPVSGVTATANYTADSATLTITSVSGVIEQDAQVNGTGIRFQGGEVTNISAFGTGTGGTGTYTMSRVADQTVTGGTISINRRPYLDTLRWEPIFSQPLSIYRSHVEDSQRMWNDFITVFGSEAAFLDRCTPVLEIWNIAVATDGRTYLEWGDNVARGVKLAVGVYFGGYTLFYSGASAAVRNALLTMSGQARRDVFVAAIAEEMQLMADGHQANAVALRGVLTSMGEDPDSVYLWIYESGQDVRVQFDNASLAAYGVGPIDQSVLRTDLINMFRFDLLDVYDTFYSQLADSVGGRITHFDNFYDMYQAWQPYVITASATFNASTNVITVAGLPVDQRPPIRPGAMLGSEAYYLDGSGNHAPLILLGTYAGTGTGGNGTYVLNHTPAISGTITIGFYNYTEFYQNNFGVSLDTTDQDYIPSGPSGSSRYSGIKAAALAYGGVVTTPPKKRRRRRSLTRH